jgi:serine/threonine-protein kinase
MNGDEFLDQLAGAVLDSTDVDWARVESSADENAQRFVRQLRLVASVGELHRRLQPVPPAAADPERRANPQWGHLRLIESMGHGSFGEVFRAWDTRLDREVALKLMPARRTVALAGESTLIQEGRMLAKVRHPNVVTIYGAEQIGDRIGLWMEFVRGRTLEQLLNDGVTFRTEDIVRIGAELSRAVAAVHSAGLLHRDIKTHNVIREDEGRIVLMDFGAGTELEGGTSEVAGTPLYLAPELYTGGAATVQSDIYSLGVLLYRLATQSYPVKGRTTEEVRRAHERGDRIHVRTLSSRVRPALARVVARACDPRPERRYESADALGDELTALQPRSAAVRIRNTIGAVAAIVAVVLLGSEAIARFTESGRPSLAGRLTNLLKGSASPLAMPVIVVRPIENLGAQEDDNLADLITDGLIRRLGLVEGLQVKGLETSFRLADAKRDFAATGKALGVNLVLEGDVRFSKERLVANAALMSVRGERVWGAPFEHAVGSERDIAAMVDDLARSIVNSLRLELGPTRMQYPTDLATLRTLQQARSLRDGRGTRGQRAVAQYKKVIDAYPDHAPALAELATIYGDLAAQFPTAANSAAASFRPSEMIALIEPLARRALDIDNFVAEAHAAMGYRHALELDWERAEAAFLKAIELEPTRSMLKGDYVLTVLVPSGRLPEAINVLDDALVDDPESLDLRRILARVQLNAGRYTDALNSARLVLQEDPSFPFVDVFAAWAQLFSGKRAEALEWFHRYSLGNDGLAGTADDRPGVTGWIHAINGRRVEAEAVAAMPQFAGIPLRRVEIFGLLRDAEKTLDALEQQARLNPLRAAFYLTYPELHFLRGDPRLAEFRRNRLALP